MKWQKWPTTTKRIERNWINSIFFGHTVLSNAIPIHAFPPWNTFFFCSRATKKSSLIVCFLHISSFLQCVRCTLYVTKSENWLWLHFGELFALFAVHSFSLWLFVISLISIFLISSQSWAMNQKPASNSRDVAAFELIIWHVFVQENGAKLKLFGGQRKIEFLWDFRTMITVIFLAAAVASSWLAVLFVCCNKHTHTHTRTAWVAMRTHQFDYHFFFFFVLRFLFIATCMHRHHGRDVVGRLAAGHVGKCNLMDNELQQWILCIFLFGFHAMLGCRNGLVHCIRTKLLVSSSANTKHDVSLIGRARGARTMEGNCFREIFFIHLPQKFLSDLHIKISSIRAFNSGTDQCPVVRWQMHSIHGQHTSQWIFGVAHPSRDIGGANHFRIGFGCKLFIQWATRIQFIQISDSNSIIAV